MSERLKDQIQRQERLHNPQLGIQEDFDAVYNRNEIQIGSPAVLADRLTRFVRENSVAIIGAQLGDEGKGRIVDNTIQNMLGIKGVKMIYVVRFQGGGNAGHTVENDKTKLALHQVPSGILYPEAVCLMDSGMLVNPENLMHEIALIEANPEVGDTTDRIILSEKASLTTPLEEAKELFNRYVSTGAKGGTGRGISPTAAGRIDRTGILIREFLAEDWRGKLGKRYERYERMFEAEENLPPLSEVETPDFYESKRQGKAVQRKIGTKEEFLDRLEAVRDWLISRDMVKNVTSIHQRHIQDISKGFIFEGAQAVGLHPWLGTFPDVTSTDTTKFGIQTSTGVWKPGQIEQSIGVFKATYTSSVGSRTMPTEVNNGWAKWVREEEREYGTTTGRPRDILHLDLPLLTYNANMGGIDVLAATHLDIAREGEPIKICTHYTDSNGNFIPYQPDLEYLEKVKPHYIEVPGWDGMATREVNSFDELPLAAKQFLAFIQWRTGFPVIAATTGPARENYIDF